MFLSEWIDKLKLDYAGVINGVRMLNINNTALIVDAKLNIITYTTTRIILQHKKTKVYIYGENLRISEYCDSQTIIRGNITCASSQEVSLC